MARSDGFVLHSQHGLRRLRGGSKAAVAMYHYHGMTALKVGRLGLEQRVMYLDSNLIEANAQESQYNCETIIGP